MVQQTPARPVCDARRLQPRVSEAVCANAAQRKKELMAQKSQATQVKGQKAKPVAKDIANREGKRKRDDGPKGRQAPSKKTKSSDDPPPRKKRVANPASQVLLISCFLLQSADVGMATLLSTALPQCCCCCQLVEREGHQSQLCCMASVKKTMDGVFMHRCACAVTTDPCCCTAAYQQHQKPSTSLRCCQSF